MYDYLRKGELIMSKEKSLVVDNIQSLEELISSVKEAQRIFSTYSQEQVDKIFTAAALAANKARIPLAKMAVKETGMGIVEDKVIKNHYAAEYIYNAYRDTRTCGVIEEDKAYGIKKIAEPIGVVAAVIPTTNPTSSDEALADKYITMFCEKTSTDKRYVDKWIPIVAAARLTKKKPEEKEMLEAMIDICDFQ